MWHTNTANGITRMIINYIIIRHGSLRRLIILEILSCRHSSWYNLHHFPCNHKCDHTQLNARLPSNMIAEKGTHPSSPVSVSHKLSITQRSEIRLLKISPSHHWHSVFALWIHFLPQNDVQQNNKWADVWLIFCSDSDSWRLLPPFLSQPGVYMWLVNHMVCSSEFFGALQTSEESYLSGIP